MEIREFAERVVFGTSLEEKLTWVEDLTDEHPAGWTGPMDRPGRPQGLMFAEGSGGGGEKVALHRLEEDSVRARVLHFFANHELLATELMGLVLLKFPDAPEAFRRGVLRTLRDEQVHTGWYRDRLKEMGYGLGDFPVNGFFWKMIAGMESPMDYVCRLSLTFEQANLDFSGFYAERFRLIGDEESAGILGKIFQDELAHVGYGLKWFRRWKDPTQSDWEAFKGALHFPLSPNRAKSDPFNAEARRRVGLDEEFIRELAVFSRSKGRTPDVYWFNPSAEFRMIPGRGTLPAARVRMERDLEVLPMFVAHRDDVVLVRERPRMEFLMTLQQAGLEIPEFEVLVKGKIDPKGDLKGRRLRGLRPWAWSGESQALMAPLRKEVTGEMGLWGEAWREKVQPMFSKQFGVECLERYLREGRDWKGLCSGDRVGREVRSLEEALQVIGEGRGAGEDRWVAKCFYGLAGVRMIRLWEEEVTDDQRRWMERVVEEEGGFVLEPWLERVLDFSMHWEMREGRLREVGLVRMLNDVRGQYEASVYVPHFLHGLSGDLKRFLQEGSRARWKEEYGALGCFLEGELKGRGYLGAVGVDAMVYRERDGELKLKPIVEVNPRMTMGRVALELGLRFGGRECGLLGLISLKRVRHQGFEGFADWWEEVRVRYGPVRGREGGILVLNDPSRAEGVVGVWVRGKDLPGLMGVWEALGGLV